MIHSTDTLDRSPGNGADPSVTSALERLAGASQGVITKKIDLALLEGKQLVSQTARSAAFGLAGGIIACASWFALVASCVLYFLPAATAAMQLGAFAIVNGVIAAGLLTAAAQKPSTDMRTSDHATNGADVSTIRTEGERS